MPIDDVTELQRQVDLLRHAQELGRYGAFDWDLRTGTITWADRTFELLGRPRGAVEETWEGFQSCIHPDDLDHVQQQAAQVIETGVHPEVHYRVLWPDGSVRHIISRGRLVHEGGEPVRMIGFMQDVTEQVERDRRVRRQSRLLDEAQRLGRMGAWSMDVDTGIVSWSAATYAIYGLDPSLPVDLDRAVAGLGAEDRRRAQRLVQRAVDQAEPYEDTFDVVRPDGSRIRAHVVGRVEVIEGRVRRVYGVIQDITDQERRYEERLRLDRLQSLGHLAGGLAHDLNNYLTSTTLALSLLDGTSLPPDEQDSLQDAFAGLRAARTAATGLLAFARGGTAEQGHVELAGLLDEVSRFALRGRPTPLSLDLPPEPLTVYGDRGQFEQVISNLVLNAAQAMDRGGRVTVSAGRTDDGLAWFEVRDEGPGIPEELRERIFQPYMTTKPSGTGLGLATCRAVVERHGGMIEARPVEAGACLRVSLPLSSEPPPPAPPAAAERVQAALEGCRILVYDDDVAILRILGRVLRRHGARVELCATAEDLEASLRDGLDPHLAILDATVPGEPGGYELGPTLREQHPDMKLVLSSGYARHGLLDWSSRGFDGVLPKPYTTRDLIDTLVSLLDDAS